MGSDHPSWSIDDARRLYGLDRWALGLFDVNSRGHVVVQPRGPTGPQIDLDRLADELQTRGLSLPLLVRFPDILKARLDALGDAFAEAIAAYGYRGSYQGVLPVKVNHQRHVVEDAVHLGRDRRLGLEVGSRPELILALSVPLPRDALLVCNGTKDRAYLETALWATRLHPRTVIVIDRWAELERVVRASRDLGIRPRLGARARVATRGVGRWEETSGPQSKFGLSAAELVRLVHTLRREDMLDCLEMLHFHMGSQITDIAPLRSGVHEAARLYGELIHLGAPMGLLDIGGGLAVDYDGTRSRRENSSNYTIEEYTRDVVSRVMSTCDEAGVPHPTLVTEAGRALLAPMSVFLLEIQDVKGPPRGAPRDAPDPDQPKVLHDLYETLDRVGAADPQESLHDATVFLDEAQSLFRHGVLDLVQRAHAEDMAAAILRGALAVTEGQERVPGELQRLRDRAVDTYYGNFSLFQSLPDHWAIGQIFPVLPIHRLDTRPDRRGVVVDLTCDSDGALKRYPGGDGPRPWLPLHHPTPAPYILGVFLVGAYQETLGDLHNLFGHPHAVQVGLTDTGHTVRHVIEGDTVGDVLDAVQFERAGLLERLRQRLEIAVAEGALTPAQSGELVRHCTESLADSTYLAGPEGRP